ncbi:MAG: Inositol 2-dehydrogenase/D-chiro-inositol 3-dehydrogenase [Phycisphaerae bacterium]|nr:Inositol 2-dehydrogenase/D-chiro-inositol 3-dehydrogenase [Phycisphaerae bacterium]
MSKLKTLRLALIGSGGNTRVHLRRLAAIPEVSIVGITEPSADQLAATAAAFPALAGLPTFDDHRRMLRAVQADAVLISTPHTQHTRQVLDALAAGLHVQCEKPLACTVADTKRIVAAATKARRQVVISFQRRWTAQWQFIRAKVRSPEFGRPLFVQSFLSQAWLQLTRGKWRQKKSLSGGGQLNDSGAHLIDMIFWTLPSRPVEVTAMMDNRGTEVDIDSAISYRFADGCLGSLAVPGAGPKPVFWEDVTIIGDKGLGLFLRNGTLTLVDDRGVAEQKSYTGGSDPDRHFVDVVLKGAKNECPPADFLPNIAFTTACWKSAAMGGRPVKIAY